MVEKMMICDREKCTGCFACYNICPKQVIQMKEDEYGNIYPTVDEEKCVHCNLCKKTCPALNKEKLKLLRVIGAMLHKKIEVSLI